MIPYFYGTPGGIRTPGLRIRSPALYPAELRARKLKTAATGESATAIFLWGE